jgi:diguanylate cyclase (GGDEF)-like protein
MLHLISSILMIENRDELYDTLLESASGLVGAINGSFMVMDANGEDLCIEATKGLNAHLAKSFIVKVGEGIAGKVAAGATPLLIRDIETDSRVARTNRSRFKTKSFVSLPVSYDQRVIGVLNLSDKDNGSEFNEKDLETLTSFAGHLAGVVYRCRSHATAQSSSSALLSDPLTGLYTQPFLMKRVQEEISRCKRQGRIVALMRIELTGAGTATDRAVKAVAEILGEMLRDMDVISRCGETSLCIMLPETGKREAVLVGERIRAHLVEAFALMMEPQVRVAVSVSVYPEDGKNFDELMAAAERVLFRSDATAISGFMPLPERLKGVPASSGLFGTSIMLHDSRQLLPLFHDRPDRDNQPDVQPVLAESIDLSAE